MINKGFKEQDKSLSEFKRDVESRFKEQGENLLEFKNEMHEFREEFNSLSRVVYSDHGRRLRKIENKLAIA